MNKFKTLLLVLAVLISGSALGALPAPEMIVGINLGAIKDSKFLAAVKALVEKKQPEQNIANSLEQLMFAKEFEIYQVPGGVLFAKLIAPTVTPDDLVTRGIPNRELNGRTVFDISIPNGTKMVLTFVSSSLAVVAPEAQLDEFIKSNDSFKSSGLYKLYTELPGSAMIKVSGAPQDPKLSQQVKEVVAIITDKGENLQLLLNVKCSSTEMAQMMEFQAMPVLSMLANMLSGGDKELTSALQSTLKVSRREQVVVCSFELSPANVERIAQVQIKKQQSQIEKMDSESLLIK